MRDHSDLDLDTWLMRLRGAIRRADGRAGRLDPDREAAREEIVARLHAGLDPNARRAQPRARSRLMSTPEIASERSGNVISFHEARTRRNDDDV
jgi:hypothetical protein